MFGIKKKKYLHLHTTEAPELGLAVATVIMFLVF